MTRLTALPLCLMIAAPALAQEAPLPPGMEVIEVIDGWQTPSGERIAALRIALDQGWKTYWRSPGDAGIPPSFNFTDSRNVAAVEMHWPAPEVFDQNGLRSVGYHDELILPLAITPADPTQPVALSADLELGICHDVCVPVSLEVSKDLQGPGAPNETIRAAMTAQPRPIEGGARCTVEPIADGMRVTALIDLPADQARDAFLELRSTPMWVSDAVARRDGDTLIAMAEFVPENAKPFALDQNDLRITVLSENGALEINGCPN
ncbi:protein-disulfide reductase DsbD domain-containing protein [Sedimentimonas flavescens]|uniref:protein-disulfide reductase DsbD domain-containing protein n=1 Tax=Sedimentimonas flavescens TaxID=2851012 RepID=UPI0021A85254|nr:protein-disulfide reductase DsbD domain-containing protein [Sedimentimonas flavescens]MCT2539933.1 protein-disulfide reductase DsbD family protein [Sedimentimonas flavescens]WBL33422.1 protein-disulfide reductase DsbD family protein [Sinirhodobacter sp. HNIBRBA609]